MTGIIYLAGVISNGGTLPPAQIKRNLKVFKVHHKRLTKAGWKIHDPTTIKLIEGSTWSDYMRVTIPMLCQCAGIVLLPGWFNSPGARLEFNIAVALGLHVMEVEHAT